MDATAVSIGVGASLLKWELQSIFRLALYFGLFQFLMPILGWFVGHSVSHVLQRYDHWLAFVLLILVAVRMIYESFHSGEEFRGDPTRGLSLFILSVATSIDALAVGLTLAFLGVTILYPSAVIGSVAFVFSLAAGWFGYQTKRLFGKAAKILGAAILMVVAVRILISHLLASI